MTTGQSWTARSRLTSAVRWAPCRGSFAPPPGLVALTRADMPWPPESSLWGQKPPCLGGRMHQRLHGYEGRFAHAGTVGLHLSVYRLRCVVAPTRHGPLIPLG